MTFRLSENKNEYIGASKLFEKKIHKMTSLCGRYGPGSVRAPTSKNIFFFLCVEFYCDHFKPIIDEYGHFENGNFSPNSHKFIIKFKNKLKFIESQHFGIFSAF